MAAITAVAWIVAVGFQLEVLERVVTVLVIACPHALGLAIPLVVAISTSLGARNGILVRDRLALEAAIEGDSEHLIARSIRNKAEERNIAPLTVDDFEAVKGRGVRATHEGRTVYVGGPRLLEMLSADLSGGLALFTENAGKKGQSVVYLVDEERPVAAFALADVIRPESYQAVKRLQEMGVEVAMLTGDSRAAANAVAEELNIGTVLAEVLPENKDRKVFELQSQGKRVAMVGDGVNDAPALTRADVGIAIGSGTDVAIESAGIILVQSNPLDVVKIFELSRATYRKMVQNLIWATGYNVVALPLAAGVFVPGGTPTFPKASSAPSTVKAPWKSAGIAAKWRHASFREGLPQTTNAPLAAGVLAWAGFVLSPAVGALLMSLSTVIVAINAQLLRRVSL